MKNRIESNYFDWMCDLVCDSKTFSKYRNKYSKLLHFLNDIPFYYSIEMDGNRYEDGINLRYRFADASRCPDYAIQDALDNRDCSVLEMMVALAFRCEESCIDDPELGNQTGYIFWNMIDSLRLTYMTNPNFDEGYCDWVIHRFLDRKYESNGEGGLFTLSNPRRDMTTVEIWMQAMWYLHQLFERGMLNG